MPPGCVESCAYCSIRNAIGGFKSKPVQACAEEYRELLGDGYRRFVITADNVGAYGLDLKSSFAALLAGLDSATDRKEVWWDIRELHPRWVILYEDDLSRIVKKGRIRQLSCPIQSGSNRILELMKRHHSIEEITAILLKFRENNPWLWLYTQIIVGFPSETEEDFRATLRAVETIGCSLVGIYPYYDGYGTIASTMDGKIDRETIRRRMKTAVDFVAARKILHHCDDIDDAR